MTSYRVLLAGAGGVIGRRLMPMLRAAGHRIAGTTRSLAKAQELRDLGADPVVVDVFDVETLSRLVASVRPEIVIHQLTDLPMGLEPSRMDEAITRNARIRDEGTRNLASASIAAGARRLIAQSIAWAYAAGPLPHRETDPLDTGAQGTRGVSVRGVAALESWTSNSPPLEGLVLRYGRIYGPGTGADSTTGSPSLHVDAAAYAALLAVDRGLPGIFNIAEPDGQVATEKASAELGWHSDFRLPSRTGNTLEV
jgi:nucleoside-diphosphate-sugar epimerase